MKTVLLTIVLTLLGLAGFVIWVLWYYADQIDSATSARDREAS